jgi:flagellar hook-basal body complex protein FliE
MSGLSIAAVHRARIAGLGMEGPRPQGVQTQAPAGISFGDSLKQALGEVSAVEESANQVTDAFLRGEPVEMHQVMAAAEEAGIAIEMLVEVRNKMVDAYRTLISMQS